MKPQMFIRIFTILLASFASFSLSCEAGNRPLDSVSPQQHTLHILAIGVDDYQFPKLRLKKAVADAKSIAELLEEKKWSGYERVEKHLLVNEAVTKANVVSTLENIIRTAQPSDLFVFMFSGSGLGSIIKAPEQDSYLFLCDFQPKTGSTGSVDLANSVGSFSIKELSGLLSRIPCKNEALIFDTCESSKGVRHLQEVLIDRADISGLGRNISILSVDNEEDEGPEHGELTSLLLKGLSGDADTTGNGQITAKELFSFAANMSTEKPSRSGMVAREFSIGSQIPLIQLKGTEADSATTRDANSTPTREAGSTPTLETGSTPGMLSRDVRLPNKPLTATTKPSAFNGTNRAIFFASDKYEDSKIRVLKNPILDARALSSTLRDSYGWQVDVFENPTIEKIDSVIREYAIKKYNPDDQLMVFFSGHGDFDDVTKTGFVAGTDSKNSSADVNHRSWLKHTELLRYMQAIPSKHTLLVLDTCFGGMFSDSIIDELTRSRSSQSPSAKDPYNELTFNQYYELFFKPERSQTRWFLAAGEEKVPDGYPGEHSPLVRRLLDLLLGEGLERGYVTRKGIDRAIENVVSAPISEGMRGDGVHSTFLFVAKPELARKKL